MKDPLVWIDCEMTGLDLEHDVLVEVAVVVTDADLRVVDPGIDIVIRPPQQALDQMGDFVRAMHTSSGLMEDLPYGLSLEDAEQKVLDYIKRFVPVAGKALLAGNSVHTDKEFLAIGMPRVIDHLHYRIVDVSSIKELAKRWYPRVYENSPDKHGGHRALADILESIQELEYFRRALFPEGKGPSRAEAKAVRDAVVAEQIPARNAEGAVILGTKPVSGESAPAAE